MIISLCLSNNMIEYFIKNHALISQSVITNIILWKSLIAFNRAKLNLLQFLMDMKFRLLHCWRMTLSVILIRFEVISSAPNKTWINRQIITFTNLVHFHQFHGILNSKYTTSCISLSLCSMIKWLSNRISAI